MHAQGFCPAHQVDLVGMAGNSFPLQPPLANVLTTAEAHGELWVLVVRHADGRLELHKTDTFKQRVEADDLEAAMTELEDGLTLVRRDPASCLEALEAEVELLFDCPICRAIYDTA
jgi:hypothetical protein